MKKEIIVLEKPKIPIKWDYNQSIKKVKVLVYKWKNLTVEVVNELFIAREILSNQGARTDLEEVKTWEDYCNDIGIEKRTGNLWLQRYLQPREKIPEVIKLPAGKFTIIYADPPWQFDNAGFTQSAASHYPTMSTEEICNMEIPDISEKDAILFLWATNAMLQDALLVMKSWGFEYKSNMVWTKLSGVGIGWFVDSRHELLLIGVKGQGLHPEWKPISWQQVEKTIHSKKPELFYEIIEKMYPKQKYIELFLRGKPRKGWQGWGNEMNSDNI